MEDLSPYLAPTTYFDFDHERVQAFVAGALSGLDAAPGETTAAESEVARAQALYLAVRDGVRYNPYVFNTEGGSFQASAVLRHGKSYCIPKAVLLGAAARAAGIPSRLGLANVRNHLSSPQLLEHLRTDVFAMHGYIELFLLGKWVKATPAFDAALCERMGVRPLDFDGRRDSVFHEFTADGAKHMEYLDDHGTHADVPVKLILAELRRVYPHLVDAGMVGRADVAARSLQDDLDHDSLS